jgi:hypothetical protein
MKFIVKIQLPIIVYIDIFNYHTHLNKRCPRKKCHFVTKVSHSTLHVPQVYVLMVPLEYESSCIIIYVEIVQKSNFYKSL